MSGFQLRDRPEHAGHAKRRSPAGTTANLQSSMRITIGIKGFTGMTGWALTGPIRYTCHAAIQRETSRRRLEWQKQRLSSWRLSRRQSSRLTALMNKCRPNKRRQRSISPVDDFDRTDAEGTSES
jgi:hypothetical protein